MSTDQAPDHDAVVPSDRLTAAGANPEDVLDASEDDYVDIDTSPGDPLAALLGGAGGAGGLDFGALMEQASEMQSQLLAAQQHVTESVVEGVAGGGAVRVSVSGGLDFKSVTIEPSAVDPDDVEMLQVLVLAALRDAVSQINELQAGSLRFGGTDLGGLLGG
jgi:hypothetical protein